MIILYFADPASQISHRTRPRIRPQNTNPSDASVKVKVTSSPAAVHGTVRVNEGGKITLLCSITMSVTCDMKWYHKNKWLVTSSGYKAVPGRRSTYLVSINGKLEENSLDMFQSSFSRKGNITNSSLILNKGQSFASYPVSYTHLTLPTMAVV